MHSPAKVNTKAHPRRHDSARPAASGKAADLDSLSTRLDKRRCRIAMPLLPTSHGAGALISARTEHSLSG
jgi:hypothetical protein